ncbi:O-antigen polymerase [Aminivibrio sp.]|uniref:O-antigen polymerase n=1 Tax=Aminivibrio sp. TaxID=1872489 RepID=UPI003D959BAB
MDKFKKEKYELKDMKKNNFFRQTLEWFLNILLLFFILFISFLSYFDLNKIEMFLLLPAFSWLLTFLGIALLLVSSRGKVTFSLIFTIIFIAYQIFPILLTGPKHLNFGFTQKYHIETVVFSWKIILVFFYFFVSSASFFLNYHFPYKRPALSSNILDKELTNKIFVVLVLITSIPQLILYSGYAWYAIRFGYSALVNSIHLFSLYDQNIFDSVLLRITNLHIPITLILWHLGLRNRRKSSIYIALLFLIVNITIMVITGYRGKAIFPLLSCLIIYQSVVKPLSIKRWLTLGICLIILGGFVQIYRLQTGGFISKLKNTDNLELEQFFSSITAEGTNKALFETVYFFSNNHRQWNFKSFLHHTFRGIPIIGLKISTGDTPSEWYNKWVFYKEFMKGYGTGYSLVAESLAYLNNAFFLFAIFLGILIGNTEKILRSSDALTIFLYIPLLQFILASPRNTVLNIFISFYSVSFPIAILFFVINYILIPKSTSEKISG